MTEKIKNITFNVFLKDYKIYKLEDTILVIMTIEDGNKSMNALLIADHDEYSENIIKTLNLKDKYYIRGDILPNIDFLYEDLKKVVKDNIKEEIIKDKVLFIKSITKIN